MSLTKNTNENEAHQRSFFRNMLACLSLFGLPVDPSVTAGMHAPGWLKLLLSVATIAGAAWMMFHFTA